MIQQFNNAHSHFALSEILQWLAWINMLIKCQAIWWKCKVFLKDEIKKKKWRKDQESRQMQKKKKKKG